MPIERNAAGSGAQIPPGEYKAKIIETSSGLTKKKSEPMLTVVFQSGDYKVKGFFVKTQPHMMKTLGTLKIAAGLTVAASADDLIGKEVGILVEMGRPREDGSIYPSIVGYGPASQVAASSSPQPAQVDDGIPF